MFQKLLNEASKEFVFSKDKLLEMINHAVEQEIRWTNHITGGNDVLGISERSTTDYTRYLSNLRLKAIGLEPIYPEVKNPYKHLDFISDISSDAGTKSNFFESSVTSYVMSSGVKGWDDI